MERSFISLPVLRVLAPVPGPCCRLPIVIVDPLALRLRAAAPATSVPTRHVHEPA
jgi:hypothetical protein